MILFRTASTKDLEAIHALALQSGSVGITTLPKDKKLLKTRLDWSRASFKKEIHKPEHEYYWFVLEDTESKEVIGTSAIEASTGYDSPFYSYKLAKRTRICHSLDIRSDYETLNLVNDYQYCSELCTLFLREDYRRHHYGLLLSKARFLFMAHFPERFTPKVIAEMRGVSDEEGRSPFWDNIGQHFFQMSFAKADALTTSTNKQFIADLMPRNPIYVQLLSQEAQNVIGQAHASTVAAMKILEREGFRYQDYVDIFDAGPSLEAALKKIKTLANSRLIVISDFSDSVRSDPFLLANTELHFRASLGPILIDETHQQGILSKEIANLLYLKKGDQMRIAPLQF